MSFTINFETATLDYDFARGKEALKLFQDGRTEVVGCKTETGYVGELRYFTCCVRRGEKPSIVTGRDALECLRVLEAEQESVASQSAVNV
jgi:predicted dehydrogenase